LREILQLRRKVLPAGHIEIANTLAGLGSLLTANGKAKEGEPLLRESLEIRHKSLPKGHWLIADTQSLLGGCLTEQARYPDAEPLLLGGYEALEKAQGVPSATLRRALERVIRLYQAWGKAEKADLWRAKQDQLIKRAEGSGRPSQSPNP